MTSLLIDALLMVALVVVALRTGRLMRELRSLRESEAGLAAALAESESALNRAAEAVVALKYDGLDAARALEAHIVAAGASSERLARLVERADFHAGKTAAPRDLRQADQFAKAS